MTRVKNKSSDSKMKLLAFTVIWLCALHDIKAHRILGNLASRANHFLDNVLVRNPCDRDVAADFTRAVNDFVTRVYKRAADYSNDNFVVSPLTLWLSLAGIAEGADVSEQHHLFEALNLPEEACLRENFYRFALDLDRPGTDVAFQRSRALICDEELVINSGWAALARKTKLEVAFAPLKSDPVAATAYVQKVMSLQSEMTVSGNSVLVDSLDFEGLWTTAFPEGSVERAPFYDDAGNQIGQVDLMRMKNPARLAHLPLINAKVLELPVGTNGRYTMLITMGLKNKSIREIMETFQSSFFIEILQAFTESLIPLDIAIPKFTMTSEFDARPILEDIGIKSIWEKPSASMNISNPPAIPGALIQRVTLKIGSEGVNPPPRSGSRNIFSGLYNLATSRANRVASAVGHDFIANKPFMYSLIDTESKTCLFAGAFSKPSHV